MGRRRRAAFRAQRRVRLADPAQAPGPYADQAGLPVRRLLVHDRKQGGGKHEEGVRREVGAADDVKTTKPPPAPSAILSAFSAGGGFVVLADLGVLQLFDQV